MSVDLLQELQQRYTTKVFDSEKKIEPATLQALKESLRLSPSSINSQPWHFFVIGDQATKERLAPVAWDFNQPKFLDASHLVVFCAKNQYTQADLAAVEENTAEGRNIDIDSARLELLSGYVNGMTPEYNQTWSRQQVAMAFGQFLLSCKLVNVDCCAIGGLDNTQLDALLGLEEKGLNSVIVAAIGYRSDEDFNTPEKAPKARLPLDAVVTEI